MATPDQVTARKMWISVIAAFLVVSVVWAVFIVVAHRANVQTVPLATKGGRP